MTDKMKASNPTDHYFEPIGESATAENISHVLNDLTDIIVNGSSEDDANIVKWNGENFILGEDSLKPATYDSMGGVTIGDGLKISEPAIGKIDVIPYVAGEDIEISTISEETYLTKYNETSRYLYQGADTAAGRTLSFPENFDLSQYIIYGPDKYKDTNDVYEINDDTTIYYSSNGYIVPNQISGTSITSNGISGGTLQTPNYANAGSGALLGKDSGKGFYAALSQLIAAGEYTHTIDSSTATPFPVKLTPFAPAHCHMVLNNYSLGRYYEIDITHAHHFADPCLKRGEYIDFKNQIVHRTGRFYLAPSGLRNMIYKDGDTYKEYPYFSSTVYTTNVPISSAVIPLDKTKDYYIYVKDVANSVFPSTTAGVTSLSQMYHRYYKYDSDSREYVALDKYEQCQPGQRVKLHVPEDVDGISIVFIADIYTYEDLGTYTKYTYKGLNNAILTTDPYDEPCTLPTIHVNGDTQFRLYNTRVSGSSILSSNEFFKVHPSLISFSYSSTSTNEYTINSTVKRDYLTAADGSVFKLEQENGHYGFYDAAGTFVPIDSSDLTPATADTLGGIKVGSNLFITPDGTLSAHSSELPIASNSVLGGVRVGKGLSINNNNGVLRSNHLTLVPGDAISIEGTEKGYKVIQYIQATSYTNPINTKFSFGTSKQRVVIKWGPKYKGDNLILSSATTDARTSRINEGYVDKYIDGMITIGYPKYSTNGYSTQIYKNNNWYCPGGAITDIPEDTTIFTDVTYNPDGMIDLYVDANGTTYERHENLGIAPRISSDDKIFIFPSILGRGRSSGKLYECQFYDNDILVRDYVPVIRELDGKLGLYDRVYKSFIDLTPLSESESYTTGPVTGEIITEHDDVIYYINNEGVTNATYASNTLKLFKRDGTAFLTIPIPVELDKTQEQYDALSEAEKNNGTYYNIIEG